MKQIIIHAITFIAALLFSASVFAQLELLAVTGPVFKHPESAVYDAKRNCIYISNMNKDTPMDSLRTDFISRMDLDGKVTEVQFVKGLSSPTGIAIYNDQLYVVERDGLAVIDLDKRRIKQRYTIPAQGFLNDIAIDPQDGTIFISETEEAGRIYRIQNGNVEFWKQDALLASTNGLLVDENRLLAGVNGDGYLKSIEIETREISNIALLGPGNIDGIQKTTTHILASHFMGNLYSIDSNNEVTELINTRDQDIFMADFAYIPSRQLLIVPSLRTHIVYIFKYED